jgi:DNA-binding NarL/FixJ family response regulator
MSRLSKPRVLLADDHRMVAEGLKSLLSVLLELIGVVEDGRALIESAKKLRPDIVVADIGMPHLNGIDALAPLKKDNPRVKVVFLTMHQEVAYARRALQAGAAGYVLKHSAFAELVAAIRAALEGKTYIPPRHREILQLLAEGSSAKQIAIDLGISSRTVEFHKYQMMESLGIHTTAEFVRFAIKQGIVAI